MSTESSESRLQMSSIESDNSNKPSTNIEWAKHLFDEWKYRHDLFCQYLFRYLLAIGILAILPMTSLLQGMHRGGIALFAYWCLICLFLIGSSISLLVQFISCRKLFDRVQRLRGSQETLTLRDFWPYSPSKATLYILGFVLIVVICVVAPFIMRQSGSPARADADEGIDVSSLVDQLRRELIASDLERTEKHMPSLLTAKSVDLEVSFVARRSDNTGSKVSIQVIDADSKQEITSERTQKMILHLDIEQPKQLVISPKGVNQ
ncbi:MAG TPA: trypco2 family protein [Candidatus Angelobacter sp.]|nr:trypco2 family protein [Candidatus Angelobacter sp.]